MNPVHLEARQPVETVNVDILKRVVNPKHFIAAAIVLGFSVGLASCGGGAGPGPSPSQFSDYVADHWPRWAGGMPDDVPPRPGTPGYDEFIAHGQANQTVRTVPPSAAAGQKNAAVKMNTVAQPAPTAAPVSAAAIAPAGEAPAQDSSVVQGGLY